MKKLVISLALFFFLSPLALAAKADVSLELREVELTGSKVILDIFIKNPSKQKIISTQTWLKYDANILSKDSIDVSNSAFDFQAPWENNFDEKKWLVKIGRSSTSWGSSDAEIFVASISFSRKTDKSTNISFYNFQLDDSWNVSVRVFDDGFPVNILKEEPKSFYVNWGTATTQVVESNNNKINKDINLSRPQGVKLATGEDYVVLVWDEVKNSRWYHVYYSNNSGRYLQRRSVGDEIEYYFENLEPGKVYYFAITAYDSDHKESDFSNEVRVRIWSQNSSTSPLLLWASSNQSLSKVKQHVETGPAEIIFWMIIISWVVSLFYLAKRRKIWYN